MKYNLQTEIQAKYNILGIDPSLPEGKMPNGIQAPDWIHEGPVYEIFLRSFSREGNFTAVSKKLGYLKDLGIKTIWLMPIHPIGRVKRKGMYGSPYAITDHMAINSDYGTLEDFKNLVDMIHDHDMRIILDMVLNHAAPDHIQYLSYPKMFNPEVQHSPEEWSDVIEFNYDDPGTNEYALEAMTYWVKEFGIDGYRCDVAGMVPLKFWQKATDKLFDLNPELFMLAEWENRALHFEAFHATYDWTGYFLMKDILQDERPASDLLEWSFQAADTYPIHAMPLRFTENHDLPRTIKTFGKHRYLPFLAYIFFSGGIPLICNGQEIGSDTELSLFEDSIIDWNLKNEQIFSHYKEMIQLRYRYRSLFNKKFQYILNDRPVKVVTFVREDGNDLLLIMINFSNNDQEIKIELPDSCNVNFSEDLIAGQKVQIENNHIKLKTDQVAILKA
jgi:cyclomaltodextrinase / maltogenic alpha-amylase / neopullulanase